MPRLLAALTAILLLLPPGPASSREFERWGDQLLAQKRWDEAIRHFEGLRKADPASVEAARGLGQAWEQKGDAATALKWYKEAARLRPGDYAVLDRISLLEARAAKASLPKVARLDKPGSLKKGNALLAEGRWSEAAAWFEGIGPQSSAKREPFRLLGLSSACIELGLWDKAAEAAKAALRADPGLAKARQNLERAQGHLNR